MMLKSHLGKRFGGMSSGSRTNDSNLKILTMVD